MMRQNLKYTLLICQAKVSKIVNNRYWSKIYERSKIDDR